MESTAVDQLNSKSTQLWSRPAEEIIQSLGVEPDSGLSSQQVQRLRQQYGYNQLKEHSRKSAWLILADQFKSLIVGLLAAASLLAFIYGEIIEAWAILVVILINAAIGFFTELKASRSMEALYKLGRVKTKVRRNGEVREIDATEIVPGDIILIEGGDVITADMRVLESSRLQCDESALTGESLPVDKQVEPVTAETELAERSSMLYKGTAVVRGSGEGLVTATGMETELGQISSLVEEAEEERTPLEVRLDRLGHKLIWLTLLITALVAVSGIIAGKDIFLMIETGIALAVAAIPEGLPIVATISLAKGMHVMARRNALINRLSSVETLGATNVIFTDKTGTLTENRMQVTYLSIPSGDYEIDRENGTANFSRNGNGVGRPLEDAQLKLALQAGVFCNNATFAKDTEGKTTGDPLEIALLEAAHEAGIEKQKLLEEHPEEREEAFDPDVAMMATWNRFGDAYRVSVKGAPGKVLERCRSVLTDGEEVTSLTDEAREQWLNKNNELAANGLRMIALAYRKSESTGGDPYKNLTFIGLVALLDPPRSDVRQAIEECKNAGIRVVMVTGDQPETARYIGESVGIQVDSEAKVIRGSELSKMNIDDDSSDVGDLDNISIFARISPKQKLDLINLYQKNKFVVAMTGDGVNDAPALKKADIGIAMGQRGTQVAREAADMVLTDDAFSTIVAAVEQGRVIFSNIRRFVFYLMSCNLSEILVVGLATIAGFMLPILPLQILFLNLVTDVFPALALGVGEGGKWVMKQSPRSSGESILEFRHWSSIAGYGFTITVVVLAALWMAIDWLGMSPRDAVTISFLTLAFSQLWHVFNVRSYVSGLWDNSVIRNPWVWGALLLCVILILLAVYVPILATVLQITSPGMYGWILILAMSVIPVVAGQLYRLVAKSLS